MKKNVLKITALSLFAAALVAAPATVRAADSTNAPAAGSEAPTKHKKHQAEVLPFNGKLTAVDQEAKTITVGDRKFEITSECKIMKGGLPATLSEAVVGEMIGGAYKKNADGKLTATSVRLGLKSDGATKKKKKAGESTETSTNSAAK
jgi:hypothetical protein